LLNFQIILASCLSYKTIERDFLSLSHCGKAYKARAARLFLHKLQKGVDRFPELWTRPGDIHGIFDFYFRTVNPEESEPLYEAKLLLIGEGAAGKTSLAKKIRDQHYELQPNGAIYGRHQSNPLGL
jgi:hypothetical protein